MLWKQGQGFDIVSDLEKKIILTNSHRDGFDLGLWSPTGTGSKGNLCFWGAEKSIRKTAEKINIPRSLKQTPYRPKKKFL